MLVHMQVAGCMLTKVRASCVCISQSPAFVTKHIRNKQQDKLEAVAKRVSTAMALERFTADSGV